MERIAEIDALNDCLYDGSHKPAQSIGIHVMESPESNYKLLRHIIQRSQNGKNPLEVHSAKEDLLGRDQVEWIADLFRKHGYDLKAVYGPRMTTFYFMNP